MIKNVIFDVGMVLINFRYREYMEDLGFSKEQQEIFCEKIIENKLWGDLDLGVRKTEDIIREMKDRVTEYPAEADAFFDRISDIVETFPYALPWIREIKQKGYRVYLLSNYPKELFALHAKEKFTFADAVDGRIVSGYVKMVKPDPEIYKLLCMTYDLQPEECVFLDDREDNLNSAEALGFHTIRFQNYEQARTELEALLKEHGKAERDVSLRECSRAETDISLKGYGKAERDVILRKYGRAERDVSSREHEKAETDELSQEYRKADNINTDKRDAAENMFGIDHYAISVSGSERSRKFYEKLGFRTVKDYQADDGSVRILQMEKNGFLLEMFCYPDSDPTPDFVEKLDTDLHVNGAKHMALAVKDPQKAAEYLLKEGIIGEMPVIKEGRLGRPYFFIKDPDGIFVEIITG